MNKLLIILFLFSFFLSSLPISSAERFFIKCDSALVYLSLNIAKTQIGVKEKTGKNDGKEVESYLKSVGLTKGNPYCYAGQYWTFYKASYLTNKKICIPKSGLANSIFNYAKKNGKKTNYKVRIGDFIVWKYSNSWSGHIERVDSVCKAGWVRTVAFNSSGIKRDGDGVHSMIRNIAHPLGKMQIRGLVGLNK